MLEWLWKMRPGQSGLLAVALQPLFSMKATHLVQPSRGLLARASRAQGTSMKNELTICGKHVWSSLQPQVFPIYRIFRFQKVIPTLQCAAIDFHITDISTYNDVHENNGLTPARKSSQCWNQEKLQRQPTDIYSTLEQAAYSR